MKNKSLLLFFALFVCYTICLKLYAQTNHPNNCGVNYYDGQVFPYTTEYFSSSGNVRYPIDVIEGNSYQFSTCGASYNTEITLHGKDGGNPFYRIVSEDRNTCTSDDEQLVWEADGTKRIWISIKNYDCSINWSNVPLQVLQLDNINIQELQDQRVACLGTVTFNATVSLIQNSGTIPTFEYQWQVNSGSSWQDISGEDTDQLVISDIQPNQFGNRYRVKVVYDRYTEFSNAAVIIENAVDPPSGLYASEDNCSGEIEIEWEWYLASPGNFKIEYTAVSNPNNWRTLATVSGSARRYTHENAQRGLGYLYRIRTYSDACGAYTTASESVIGISPSDPVPPTDLSYSIVNNAGGRAIQIDWIDRSDNEDGFIVSKLVSNGSTEKFRISSNSTVSSSVGSAQSYLDDNTRNCSPYTYRVYAYNVCEDEGLRDPDEQLDVTITVPLDNVLSINSFSASRGYYADRVSFSWAYEPNSNYRYADGYKIYSRQLGSNNAPTLLYTAGSENFDWETARVSAGVLFEYFLIAKGRCGDEEITSYDLLGNISSLQTTLTPGETIYDALPENGVGYGIGFRSPSGIINGNISYNGGVAVPNVKVTVNPTQDIPGSVLYFDGADDYVSIDSTDYVASFGEDFSVSAWIRPERLSGIQYLVSKESNFALAVSDDDVLLYISDGSSGWEQISADDVLTMGEYINITATYDHGEAKIYLDGVLASQSTVAGSITYKKEELLIGGAPWATSGHYFEGYIDEVRLFDIVLAPETIARDHSRFIAPDKTGLLGYWRFDEGYGNFVFDISSSESVFHQNDGRISGASWSDVAPLERQLGLAGYSDMSGNYTISGILYTGSGQSFDITPTITLAGAVHEFTPVQRTEFIGEANAVLSSIDFTDISSFTVSGQVVFEHNGNQSGSPGVNFYIDGSTPIAQADGTLVSTDVQGNFQIEVPIGLHYIVARKAFHDFANDGKWPTLSETYDFQDIVTGLTIIDETRRTVIGRVAGGLVEGEKKLGYSRSTNNIGQAHFVLRSQDNFIEEAISTDITTGEYSVSLPPKTYTIYKGNLPTDPGIQVVNNPDAELYFTPLSNVDISNVPHKSYEVDTVYSSVDPGRIERIDSVEYHIKRSFIYRSVPQITVKSGEAGAVGDPFAGEETFVYQSVQGFIDTIDLNYERPGGIPFPVFKKFTPYRMHIALEEEYVNLDDPLSPQYSTAPVTDGTLTISNYIGKGFYTDSQRMTQYYSEGAAGTNPDIISINSAAGDTTYSFVTTDPEISLNASDPANSFTKTLQITAQAGGNIVYWPGPDQQDVFRGYIFGSTPIGSSFVTKAPNMVDFILRDPPGTNSFTEFTRGQTISKTNALSVVTTSSTELELGVGASTTTFMGGGVGVITGVINEAETTADLGFSFEIALGYEGEWVESYSIEESFATSEDLVGAEGDMYVGRSQNYIFGLSQSVALVPDMFCSNDEVACPFSGEPEEFRLTSRSGREYQIGSKIGTFLTPEGNPTFFIYTQQHIEDELIPRLSQLRNGLLLNNPKYTSHVPGDHALYGQNNDFPDWPAPTSAYPETHPSLDFDGPSYTFTPDNNQDIDSVRWYNQQIRLWEESIANNEKAKVRAAGSGTGSNKSFSAQTSYTSTVTEYTSQTDAVVFETNTAFSIGSSTDIELFGTSIDIDFSQSFEVGTSYNYSHGVEREVSFSYTLADENDGDFFSVDVYPGEGNNGPVFILRDGGESSCPHEEAFETQYFRPGTVVGSGTLQRDKPRLSVDVPVYYNVPSNSHAVYTLTLYNDSESMDEMDYVLDVVDSTNPNGAVLTIDGSPVDQNVSYNVPGGGAIQKTLLMGKGPFEYNYQDVEIEIMSSCDDDISQPVAISAYFSPACTDVELLAPKNNWVLNTNFNDTLDIVIGGYDINYAGLERIDLLYKPTSASSWILLKKFYRDLTGITDADALEIPKTTPTTTFRWDVSQLADGNYDLLVSSNCAVPEIGVDVTTESDVFSGLSDRVTPHAFGRPSPADGVLSSNDEILVQFNEPVNSGLLSPQNFDLRGELNGGDLRHPASVYFDGDPSHYMRIGSGAIDLTKRSFTIDLYARRHSTSTAVLLSQGTLADKSLEIGFTTSDQVYFQLGNRTITSTQQITDNVWHHYAFTYDSENGASTLSIDAIVDQTSTNFDFVYKTLGEMWVGKAQVGAARAFQGNIHELRIWNRVLSEADVSIAATKRLNRSDRGLLANWRMEEGIGNVAKDHIQSKHAEVNADWQIEPAGKALSLNGNNQYAEALSPAFGLRFDFSIEFWFNSKESKEACFLSNGRGDNIDDNTDGWALGLRSDGNIFIHHNDTSIYSTDKNFHDGNWHHFGLILNRAGNTTLYVDGEQLASVRSDALKVFGGPKLWIGARGWYDNTATEQRDAYFNGSIDEIRIWNTARTSAQLTDGCYTKLRGDEVGLVRYYAFEKYTSDSGVYLVTETASSIVEEVASDPFTYFAGADYTSAAAPIKLARPVSKLPFTFSANGDRIILSPTVEEARIENVVLDISVKNVYDLHGNKLASPITWSAYVDRNQVVWAEETRKFEVTLGEPLTFRVNIKNMGGRVQAFIINNLPTWLSASPSSGTISPLSSREIEFSIDQSINIGEYIQDIYLRSDFGFDERLLLDILVEQDPPGHWIIDPTSYQYSMSVIGQIRVDGALSRNSKDRIAAFVDGEVRGSTTLSYIESIDSYIAFLSIYSNQNDGEQVTFQVWNAKEGHIHGQVTPEFTFSSNALHGSINTPTIFEVSDFINKELELKTGWQWVSFNVDDPDMSNVQNFMGTYHATEGDIVKGLSEFDQYDSSLGWVGSLTSNGGLQQGQAYKIRLNNGGMLRYEGNPLEPEDVEISLQAGWNWIGFTPQKRLSVASALSRLNPDVGDQIKSQLQFAVHAGGSIGWVGSLQILEPGKGYLYYSAKDATFNYPNINPNMSRIEVSSEFTVPNSSEHRDNMSVIAQIKNFDHSADDRILVKIDQEERGMGMFKKLPTGETLIFITILGQGREGELHFYLNNISTKDTHPLSATHLIQFEQDAVVGSIDNPTLLTFTEENTAIQRTDLTILPNPLTEDMMLVLGDPMERIRSIEIFSIDGRRLALIEQQALNILVQGYKIQLSDWIGKATGTLIVKAYTDQHIYTARVIRN